MPTGLQAWCGCFQSLSAMCGSFLPGLNPAVVLGLRAGICFAVLHFCKDTFRAVKVPLIPLSVRFGSVFQQKTAVSVWFGF